MQKSANPNCFVYISPGSQGKEPSSGLITLLFNYPLLYNELHSPKSKYYKTQGDRVKVERLFQNHIIFHVSDGYFAIFHPGSKTKPPFHRNSVLNFSGFHIAITFFISQGLGLSQKSGRVVPSFSACEKCNKPFCYAFHRPKDKKSCPLISYNLLHFPRYRLILTHISFPCSCWYFVPLEPFTALFRQNRLVLVS